MLPLKAARRGLPCERDGDDEPHAGVVPGGHVDLQRGRALLHGAAVLQRELQAHVPREEVHQAVSFNEARFNSIARIYTGSIEESGRRRRIRERQSLRWPETRGRVH